VDPAVSSISDDLVVTVPARQIRASYSADTITVYQAYSPEIAESALAAGRFVPPVRAGPDDLDQAVLSVDDVPLRLGDQAGPGTRARHRDHPGPGSSGRSGMPV
jgi:Domain of unknown function (DUF4291)